MANKKKIQERDWRYDALHGYVNLFVKASYRNISYVGLERIPNDGAVIFAPNHSGALMDAMVVVAMNSGPTVFLARADIFKNPKLAKILTFFKMMPIMRMRDGIEEVKKNNRIMEIAADVLKDKVPLCMFPEGTHQTKYSMLPLSKGIFRIALQAKELLGDTPLYIVPMGIRYGNFNRFRSSVRVQVGNPINIGELIAQNSDKTPQEQMNVMRKCLEERMKENILYIPNDQEYNAKNEICATVSGTLLGQQRPDGNDPLITANQEAARRIEALKAGDPALADSLIALGNEASRMRRKMQISLASVAKMPTITSMVLKLLVLLVTLPYTLLATLFTLPLAGASKALTDKFKDRAFHNSVRFVLLLLLWPLLMVIYSIIIISSMPIQWAICAILAIAPAPAVAHDLYKGVRVLVSDFKLWRCKPLVAKYNEIRNLFFGK